MPGEQHIVADIAEMRDAALLGTEIAHRRRPVDRPARRASRAAPRPRRRNRSGASSGVRSMTAQQLGDRDRRESRTANRRCRATASRAWSRTLETRRPTTRSRGALASKTGRPRIIAPGLSRESAMNSRDRGGGMLAVGIHGQRMGEALRAAARSPSSTAAPLPPFAGLRRTLDAHASPAIRGKRARRCRRCCRRSRPRLAPMPARLARRSRAASRRYCSWG